MIRNSPIHGPQVVVLLCKKGYFCKYTYISVKSFKESHRHDLSQTVINTLQIFNLMMHSCFCVYVFKVHQIFMMGLDHQVVRVFSWEPALETLNSRADEEVKKKPLQFSPIYSDF